MLHNYDVRIWSGHVLFTIGLPGGVCNIVYGLGPRAGEALVTHPKVPVLSFTGGTVTGVRIAEKAAPYCKRLSLEVSKALL